MIELRVRTRIPEAELEAKVGKILTDRDHNVLLTGPSRVLKPDGSLLCVFVPGALNGVITDAYPILTSIRGKTNNRGLASGSERVQTSTTRSGAVPIASSILGGFDPVGPQQYCRLTAFSARQASKWRSLRPLFSAIAERFAELVPDRYAVQQRIASETHADWVIPGTPFTTITVNNTYPTGVHTDKGDLDAGFSCLAAIERGAVAGGTLVFPRYRLGAHLRTGDLILMDAHEWHGNTALYCDACGDVLREPGHDCRDGRERALFHGERFAEPERISVVAYYRTRMVECGSLSDENERRRALREDRNRVRLGLD